MEELSVLFLQVVCKSIPPKKKKKFKEYKVHDFQAHTPKDVVALTSSLEMPKK